MSGTVTDPIDPFELVKDLADKIGIHQLYAIVREMRGEEDEDIVFEKLHKLQAENDKLQDSVKYQSRRIDRLKGMIEGLKFAIRCDGVSGAEVKDESD